MQSCLRMLKNNYAKAPYVCSKSVLNLHEIRFAGFLFKYARNTIYRTYRMAEWWEKSDLLAFWQGTQAWLWGKQKISATADQWDLTRTRFFKLSRRAMDAMKLHQRPQFNTQFVWDRISADFSYWLKTPVKSSACWSRRKRTNRDISGLHWVGSPYWFCISTEGKGLEMLIVQEAPLVWLQKGT
jgi:hypothetical protein